MHQVQLRRKRLPNLQDESMYYDTPIPQQRQLQQQQHVISAAVHHRQKQRSRLWGTTMMLAVLLVMMLLAFSCMQWRKLDNRTQSPRGVVKNKNQQFARYPFNGLSNTKPNNAANTIGFNGDDVDDDTTEIMHRIAEDTHVLLSKQRQQFQQHFQQNLIPPQQIHSKYATKLVNPLSSPFLEGAIGNLSQLKVHYEVTPTLSHLTNLFKLHAVPDLLIGVLSSRGNFERRQALRDTWFGSITKSPMQAGLNVVPMFVIGNRSCSIPPQHRQSTHACEPSPLLKGPVLDTIHFAHALKNEESQKSQTRNHTNRDKHTRRSPPLVAGTDFVVNRFITITHLGVFEGPTSSPTTVSVVMFDVTRGAAIANRTLPINTSPTKGVIDSDQDNNNPDSNKRDNNQASNQDYNKQYNNNQDNNNQDNNRDNNQVTVVGSYRYIKLFPPLFLPEGFRASIVAVRLPGLRSKATLVPTVEMVDEHDGGGLITFANNYRYSDDVNMFPTMERNEPRSQNLRPASFGFKSDVQRQGHVYSIDWSVGAQLQFQQTTLYTNDELLITFDTHHQLAMLTTIPTLTPHNDHHDRRDHHDQGISTNKHSNNKDESNHDRDQNQAKAYRVCALDNVKDLESSPANNVQQQQHQQQQGGLHHQPRSSTRLKHLTAGVHYIVDKSLCVAGWKLKLIVLSQSEQDVVFTQTKDKRARAQFRWDQQMLIEQLKLQHEAAKFGDVALLPALTDTYRNLPIKLLEFYQLATVIGPKWTLKTDDDCWVNIARVTSQLQRLNVPTNGWWSQFREGWAVARFGKWAEHEFTSNVYPAFACGSGNILGSQLFSWLAQNKHSLNSFQGEDVSMGIWMSAISPKLFKDMAWSCFGLEVTGCHKQMLVVPELTTTQLRSMWDSYLRCHNICGC